MATVVDSTPTAQLEYHFDKLARLGFVRRLGSSAASRVRSQSATLPC
jgi:hypothetical protein